MRFLMRYETYETSGEPSVHGLLLELMWWQSAKTFGFQLDDAAPNGTHLVAPLYH